MAGTRFLVRSDLDRLFDALRDEGRQVLGPTVVDGAVVYDEIASAADLPRRLAERVRAGRLPPDG